MTPHKLVVRVHKNYGVDALIIEILAASTSGTSDHDVFIILGVWSMGHMLLLPEASLNGLTLLRTGRAQHYPISVLRDDAVID